MIRTCTALLIISILFMACSGADSFKPIQNYRMEGVPNADFLQWHTESGFWMNPTQRYSTSSSFIRDFARYAAHMPFPLVAWAVEGGKGIAPFASTARQTHAEALQAISIWAGPYATIRHKGFMEIAWGDIRQIAKCRDRIKIKVPPIIFQSRHAADFLGMWHEVSGMEFRYDPAVIEKCMRYDAARLAEETDPDLPLHNLTKNPFPMGFVRFSSTESLPIGDFMTRLAAHVGGSARRTFRGWVIEDIRRNQQGIQLIKDYIALLRKYDSNDEAVEILSRMGMLALPEIIDALQPHLAAHDIDEQIRKHGNINRIEWPDYMMQQKLLIILARIPSPQRDEALIKMLKEGNCRLSEALMEILAAANCQKAIPIIEQFAERPRTPVSNNETRIAARIALNALGKPWMSSQPEKNITVSASIKKILKTEKIEEVVPMLQALIEQCELYRDGMEISDISVDSANGIVIYTAYGGKFKTVDKFEIPALHDNRIMIRLAGIYGYLGRLEKIGNRWLVTRWRREWIS